MHAEAPGECPVCRPLLGRISGLRAPGSLRVPWAALDKAVLEATRGDSRESLRQQGYAIGAAAWAVARGAEPSKRGRKRVAENPEAVGAVEAALADSSRASGLYGKSSRDAAAPLLPVRVLDQPVRSVYAHSQKVMALMGPKVFGRIRRAQFLHFRKARRQTDYCDHCWKLRVQIVPQYERFKQEWRASVVAVCPEYFAEWDRLLARQREAEGVVSQDTQYL